MNLFIDTHMNDINILLYKDGKIIKEKKIFNEKENSKIIMPTIKKVLGKDKPDSIIVVNGPGSFTGVRLGVTISKTLAYTLNIPIRAITSLECMAVCSESLEKIVALSDKNGYYIGIFGYDNELIGNYEYLSINQFNEYRNKYEVITNVELDYRKIIEYTLTKEPHNPHNLNPTYIKKLDVEK